MKILISGSGQVGETLVKQLSKEGYDLTATLGFQFFHSQLLPFPFPTHGAFPFWVTPLSEANLGVEPTISADHGGCGNRVLARKPLSPNLP